MYVCFTAWIIYLFIAKFEFKVKLRRFCFCIPDVSLVSRQKYSCVTNCRHFKSEPKQLCLVLSHIKRKWEVINHSANKDEEYCRGQR